MVWIQNQDSTDPRVKQSSSSKAEQLRGIEKQRGSPFEPPGGGSLGGGSQRELAGGYPGVPDGP